MPARKRKLVWARTPTFAAGLTAVADAQFTDILANFKLDAGITGTMGMTVMRVRGWVFSANLTGGAIPVYGGIRVMNDTEFTTGVTAAERLLKSPQQDEYADWMQWAAWYPNHGADPTTGVPNALTYEFDVRSMRKIDELGQTLGWFVGKDTSVSAATVFASFSVLLALP